MYSTVTIFIKHLKSLVWQFSGVTKPWNIGSWRCSCIYPAKYKISYKPASESNISLLSFPYSRMPYLLPPEYLEYLDYLPDLQKCANVFISFTPLFSYGTTCYGIYTKKTSLGFSIDICATMLMSLV